MIKCISYKNKMDHYVILKKLKIIISSLKSCSFLILLFNFLSIIRILIYIFFRLHFYKSR